MNGQIQNEYDERARQPIDGKENDDTPAERASSVKERRRGNAVFAELAWMNVPRAALPTDGANGSVSKIRSRKAFALCAPAIAS